MLVLVDLLHLVRSLHQAGLPGLATLRRVLPCRQHPRTAARRCRADRLPGRQLPAGEASHARRRTGCVVRVAATLGLEARPPALGATAQIAVTQSTHLEL